MTKQVNLMEPQTGLDTDRVNEAIASGKLAENRRKIGANLSSDYTELTNLRWRTIPGIDGYYVSEFGHLVKQDSDVCRMCIPFVHNNGYLVGQLSTPAGRIKIFVHRLVYMAFHGSIVDGMQVAHNDGSKTNNHFSNLRLATPKENIGDKFVHGTAYFLNRRMLTNEDVVALLSMLKQGVSQRESARILSVPVHVVKGIVYGRGYKDITKATALTTCRLRLTTFQKEGQI